MGAYRKVLCGVLLTLFLIGVGATRAAETDWIVVQFYTDLGTCDYEETETDQATIDSIKELCPTGSSTDPEIIDAVAALMGQDSNMSWSQIKWLYYCDWCRNQPPPKPQNCKRCGE